MNIVFNTEGIGIVPYYTEHMCRAFPDALFIFGDNLVNHGKGGQAIIRDEPNAFGIPTKRLPSNEPNAFFSDRKEEMDIVLNRIILLSSYKAIMNYKLVFPADGIGTGLANLKNKSPKIYKLIDLSFQKLFDVKIMK